MQPGTKIGRYEILRLLAAGGMGEVYLARQHSTVPGFATLVVIKILIKSLSTNPTFVQMFLDEARIVGKLRHKNIVQVLDVARHQDQYYMVMEYIPGQNLRELLGDASILDRPLFAPRLGAEIFADVAGALAAAHAENMVHRDISPNNLMIGDEGIIKLIDFGVARALSSTSLTRPGTLKGKFSYMAPEYVRSEAYDHRIDIFSLGVVMWETFARRRLFRGPSAAEQIHQLIEMPIPSLDEVVPDFPRDLASVVTAALERDPQRRLSSAMLLADALAEIARGLPVGPDPTLRKWLENRIPGRLRDRYQTDQALSTLPHDAPIPDFGIAFAQAGSVPGTYGNHPSLLELPELQAPAAPPPPMLPPAVEVAPKRSRSVAILLGFVVGVALIGGTAWALMGRSKAPTEVAAETEQISLAEAHRELGLRALADGDLPKARREFSEAIRLGAGSEVTKLLEMASAAPPIEPDDTVEVEPVASPATDRAAADIPTKRQPEEPSSSSRRAAARSESRSESRAERRSTEVATVAHAPQPTPAAALPPPTTAVEPPRSAAATSGAGSAAITTDPPSSESKPRVAERTKTPAPVAPPPPVVPAPVKPAVQAKTPRVSTDGSPEAGARVVQACNACHAKSGAKAVGGRRYTRAQWERFFASGQHDRYVGIGDHMSAGQLQAARAYLRANAADSAEHQGAGIQD